jgi:hypothetical protein
MTPEGVAALSVKALKQELASRQVDCTGCTEKSELVERLIEALSSSGPDGTSSASEPSPDLEASFARMSNLLDTLPASLTLLDNKYSDVRMQKIRGQLNSIKALLDETSAEGSAQNGWHSRLEEYNKFARDFKRLRDMPRSMNG